MTQVRCICLHHWLTNMMNTERTKQIWYVMANRFNSSCQTLMNLCASFVTPVSTHIYSKVIWENIYLQPPSHYSFFLIKNGYFSTSARQRACYSISCNITFPSWILPLINDESLCKPLHTKMSLISIKVNWQPIHFHFEWFSQWRLV